MLMLLVVACAGETVEVEVTRVVEVEAETTNRLQAVKDRGTLICASRNDVPGYGFLDASGNNVGFDIDLCRAVATAVLGDPNAIEIRLITAAERGPTIQSGEVDMLVRTVTWTTSRDAGWGNYAQTMFYDGQGFMVNEALGVDSALELQDATVCVTQGTTTELNLQDFSNQHGLNITPLTFEDTDAVSAAYQGGQCDAFTNDRSQLAAIGSGFDDPQCPQHPAGDHLRGAPWARSSPHGDDQWFDVVKTVMAILIYGEAYGVSQSNVPQRRHRHHRCRPPAGHGRLLRPGEPGPERHRGAGRPPGRGQLRRHLRPQPWPRRHQPPA